MDLNKFLNDHRITIKEYSGPGFIMADPHNPGHKLLFVDLGLSYTEKMEWIAKGIIHSLVHQGDQTRLSLHVSKKREKEAEIGAKIILQYFL